MELIERDSGIGQIVGDAFDEGWRHVDADAGDVLRVGLVGAQMGGTSPDSEITWRRGNSACAPIACDVALAMEPCQNDPISRRLPFIAR